MERTFSNGEQSFSGMGTIVLRPENGSIGVRPRLGVPALPEDPGSADYFAPEDGWPTTLTLAGWHTRRMAAPRTGFDAPETPSRGPDSGRAARTWLDAQAPRYSMRRFKLVRAFFSLVARAFSRVRVEGIDRLPSGSAVLCFTHQSWADPFYVLAAMPKQRRMYFFGPEQEEMRRGARNRLMRWSGTVVPYRPGKRGLVAATARVESILTGDVLLAIAGEGRIHAGETVVLPLKEGPAYLALRAGVPLVPIAINGTGWLGFRRVVRVRVGPPIDAACLVPSRPGTAEVAGLTAIAQIALESLVGDFPDQPRPRLFGRLLTELFNDWPDGSRPPTQARRPDLKGVRPGSGS